MPIVVGYFPIAVSFGVAAADAGLRVTEATFMSLLIYAGASQFVALALVVGGAPLLLGVLTLLAMNARHMFYGPALVERLGGAATTRFAAVWAFGLTDEVFATALATPFLVGAGAQPPFGRKAVARGGRRPTVWSEAWMSGLAVAAYLAWVSGTYVGASLGGSAFAAYPAIEAALDFMLPALFVSLLLALLSRHQLPAALAAAAACLGSAPLVGNAGGILLGMVAGGLVASIGWAPSGSVRPPTGRVGP